MDNTTTIGKKVAEGFIGQKMIVLPPDKKRIFLKNLLSKHLYPTAIGYYPHASYHDRERKSGIEQYILLYCVDGKGWIKTNGIEQIVSPNTFFIIPKDMPHHYGSSQKEPWSIYWVHFSGEQASLLYKRYAEMGNVIQPVAYDNNRIMAFNKLVNILDGDLSTTALELVYINLLQFISSYIYTDSATDNIDNDAISASITLMKQNIKHNYSIKELAGHARYSVSRYSELFRLKTGFAPIQYFLQLKIQRSCQYLYFTKMNIKEICAEIGFDDPYYFSRMFKKQVGQPPIKYRKMHSNEN